MCEAFRVEELTLRIRATRGRSSRPNPLKDPRDSRKAPSPANFGRFVGKLHSVAKQALFNIAFQSEFEVFGRPDGCQNSIFGLFFSIVFSNAFLREFLIDFWQPDT